MIACKPEGHLMWILLEHPDCGKTNIESDRVQNMDEFVIISKEIFEKGYI